jgi:hypothetical protein
MGDAMDFMDLNEKAREAEMDPREVMSLLRFRNFRRERNGEPRLDIDYNYHHIFDRLEEAYPDITFRRMDYRIFVSVKPRSKGSLVEKIGFVSKQIPHLAMNGVYGADGVCVVFRADGVGVIKEDSWYEFFEHDLDLEKVKRECGNDPNAIGDRLRDYFRGGISRFIPALKTGRRTARSASRDWRRSRFRRTVPWVGASSTTMAPISDEAVMTGILQASPGGSAKFSNRPLPARRWRLAVSFASISNLAATIRRSLI